MGEETGKHLYLLYTNIQVVAKGCKQREAIKAILKLELPNHIMFVLISLKLFRAILMILVLLEMSIERRNQAKLFNFKTDQMDHWVHLFWRHMKKTHMIGSTDIGFGVSGYFPSLEGMRQDSGHELSLETAFRQTGYNSPRSEHSTDNVYKKLWDF